jgi:hypothetical protein
VGAFEQAVKKKEAELMSKKASAEERLNLLEQQNPTYRLAQEIPTTVAYRSGGEIRSYRRSKPNAEMLEAMQDADRGIRLERMKEEERRKAMEKGAAMREQTKPGSMQSKTGMGPAKK